MTEFDASDRESVTRRKRELAVDAKARREFLAGLLANPEGRKWIWDLLEICGVMRTSFTGNALTGAFNEGRRDVGNQLLTQVIEARPEFFGEMVKETKNGR